MEDLQPVVEVLMRVQHLDRLPEEPFQIPEKLIHLRELFTGIGEEVFDIELRVVDAHIDR